MKSIEQLVSVRLSSGMTIKQANSSVCQEIILNKISKTPFVDKVLIKGGVVMFNLSHNVRRSTLDLDFDFIKYDISEESIKAFIDSLNEIDSQYRLTIGGVEKLHQDDYAGKRVHVSINDGRESLSFKIDIGVHTLLAINQNKICFNFIDGDDIVLMANPPEQIVAEKLFSLAKHNRFSTRFKDVLDIYYLIINACLNKQLVKDCLTLLADKNHYGITSIKDIYSIIEETFNNKTFLEHYIQADDKWLDENYKTITKTILDYIYSI